MEPIQPLFAAAIASLVRPAPLTPEKIVFAWRMAVGAAVARVTRVRMAPGRTLEVEFDDDRWCGEIERSGASVLSRVQELLGVEEVERLHLKRRAVRHPQRRRRPAGGSRAPSHEGEAS